MLSKTVLRQVWDRDRKWALEAVPIQGILPKLISNILSDIAVLFAKFQDALMARKYVMNKREFDRLAIFAWKHFGDNVITLPNCIRCNLRWTINASNRTLYCYINTFNSTTAMWPAVFMDATNCMGHIYWRPHRFWWTSGCWWGILCSKRWFHFSIISKDNKQIDRFCCCLYQMFLWFLLFIHFCACLSPKF